MPQPIRRQLTLFVAEPWRSRLDAVRRVLDPVQASLISAHVTLCREDEIDGLSPQELFDRINTWEAGSIRLTFGRATRVSGHGVLVPCEHGAELFQALRRWLLRDPDARAHTAHLTLAHPRNPRSPGNTDDALEDCPDALELEFGLVALIQQEGSAPWQVLQQALLGGRPSGVA